MKIRKKKRAPNPTRVPARPLTRLMADRLLPYRVSCPRGNCQIGQVARTLAPGSCRTFRPRLCMAGKSAGPEGSDDRFFFVRPSLACRQDACALRASLVRRICCDSRFFFFLSSLLCLRHHDITRPTTSSSLSAILSTTAAGPFAFPTQPTHHLGCPRRPDGAPPQ